MRKITQLTLLSTILLALLLSACRPVTPTPPVDVPDEVETAAREHLNAETGIPVEAMEIVDAERRDWPDSCLGLAEPDEACLTVITPGWRITIQAEDEQYALRTDEDGAEVRME